MRILKYSVPRERRIGLNRLLRLADYLETVKKDNFDYGEWYKKGTACGTVACALGHAAQMKSFRDSRRCGLRLEIYPTEDWDNNGGGVVNVVSGDVTLGNLVGEDAGAAAFALTNGESITLFVSGTWNPALNRNPKKVAAKIRKFAKAELKNLDKGILPEEF